MLENVLKDLIRASYKKKATGRDWEGVNLSVREKVVCDEFDGIGRKRVGLDLIQTIYAAFETGYIELAGDTTDIDELKSLNASVKVALIDLLDRVDADEDGSYVDSLKFGRKMDSVDRQAGNFEKSCRESAKTDAETPKTEATDILHISRPLAPGLKNAYDGKYQEVLFKAFSGKQDPLVGNEPRPYDIYEKPPKHVEGMFTFKLKKQYFMADTLEWSNVAKISYTIFGDPSHDHDGPLVMSVHGVPTNKTQHYPLARRCAPFVTWVACDRLGMGKSSKPLDYPKWDWIHEANYISRLQDHLFPEDVTFVFVGDDWGGGIVDTYAAHPIVNGTLSAAVTINKVAGPGYPVPAIQGLAQLSLLPFDPELPLDHPFNRSFVMEAIKVPTMLDQVMKSMAYMQHERYNQWSMNGLLEPYADVDYMKPGANPITMGAKIHAIRVLVQQAAVLAPATLLPYDKHLNPRGIDFMNLKCHNVIFWGEYDNMMPEKQRITSLWATYPAAKRNNTVSVAYKVPRAGHFAITDNPDYIADHLLQFLMFNSPMPLREPYVGLDGVWRGDEQNMHDELVKLVQLVEFEQAERMEKDALKRGEKVLKKLNPRNGV